MELETPVLGLDRFRLPLLMQIPFCNGTGVAIPDAGCFGNTYAEVQVAHSGGTAIGTDIFLESIGITIDHTWSGDITAEVVSPNGTTVRLTSGNGGGGDDYRNAPINCGAVDRYIPSWSSYGYYSRFCTIHRRSLGKLV